MPVHRMKVGYANLADSHQKSVTIATSLEQSRKRVGLIMPTHICTYSKNKVKVGPVYSEIITGLQGKVTVKN